MKQEGELADEMSAGRFRDSFFLHAVASQNPKLYFELYDEPDVPEEWEVPQSPEDLNRMLAELAEIGVDLNSTPEPPEPPRPENLEQRYGVRPATRPWNA